MNAESIKMSRPGLGTAGLGMGRKWGTVGQSYERGERDLSEEDGMKEWARHAVNISPWCRSLAFRGWGRAQLVCTEHRFHSQHYNWMWWFACTLLYPTRMVERQEDQECRLILKL